MIQPNPFIFRVLFILLSAAALNACDIETGNNLPDVPPEGRFVALNANQHSGVDEAQVAIAMFEDGTPIKLVGGDVVQASTDSASILLLDEGFYIGSYAASLANELNINQIDFLMIHDPIATREGRWYPVDLLNSDPGPGEFVGASASVILPPEPTNLATSSSNFSSINDTFTLTWSAEPAQTPPDIMKVRAAITCTNDTKTSLYGVEAVLADESDDGSETIGLNQFIYDIDDGNSIIKFIRDEARASLQELLDKLSNGEIGDDFLAELELVNPIDNDCEIQLFLFRQRDANFDSTETNGNITGSRSADVTIFYSPNP